MPKIKHIVFGFFVLCAFVYAQDNIFHQTIANSDVYIITLQEMQMSKDILLPQNDTQKKLIQETQIKPNKLNVILIKNPKFIALIDSGFPQNQGALKASLQSLGLDFSDITHLIISHAHGDHIGGILNDKGENNFTNATLLIDKNEFDYWQTQDNQRTKDSLNAFSKKTFFNHDKAILSNGLEIYALQAYGHTPGHNLLSLQNSDSKQPQKLIYWADLLHIYDIQSKNPQISVMYDVNPKEAAQVRGQFLQQFTQDKMRVTGAHVPFVLENIHTINKLIPSSQP